MKYYPIAVAVAVLSIASIVVAQSDSDTEQIRNVRAEYNDAIARHDVPGIISFFDAEYQITTSLGQLSQDVEGEAVDWRELIASRKALLYVRSPDKRGLSAGTLRRPGLCSDPCEPGGPTDRRTKKIPLYSMQRQSVCIGLAIRRGNLRTVCTVGWELILCNVRFWPLPDDQNLQNSAV